MGIIDIDLKKKNIKRLNLIISLLDEVQQDDWLIGLVNESDDLDKLKMEVVHVKKLIRK